jgi:tRNA(fMet)-specific endonuclease VapC
VLARQATVPSSKIAITIVTRIEALQGRFDFLRKAASGKELLRAQAWLDQTVRSLAQVEAVIAIAPAAAAEFDRLRAHKKLSKIGRNDLLIASICLANRATLVTRILKHFRQVGGPAGRELGRLKVSGAFVIHPATPGAPPGQGIHNVPGTQVAHSDRHGE